MSIVATLLVNDQSYYRTHLIKIEANMLLI